MLYRKLTLIITLLSLANMVIWQAVSQRADARARDWDAKPEIVLESAPAQIPTPTNVAPPPDPAPVPQAKKTSPKKNKTAAPAQKTETPAVAPEPPAEPVSTTPITHWGVLIRPYGLKTGNQPFTKEQLTIQLDLAKELGATDVRANVEEIMATNDLFVDEAIARGLEPILILEAPTGLLDDNTRAKAYDFGKLYAARFQGRVRYYQLANEASGMAIRPGFSGKDTTDYDAVRYQSTKDIIRGLGEGVKSADSSAKRIVSANWLGTGVIDRLVADEVGFEIVGWDWYSDMGEDLIKRQDDGTLFNVPEYLSKYNKQFWIVEANRADGTRDSNFDAQANYLANLTKNVASHHNTQGFFVFGLTDICGDADRSIGHMGLVRILDPVDGLCAIGTNKPAFDVIKNAIAKYSR